MTVLVVSATGTGVGKTVVAAALVALGGPRACYVKAAQTGVPPDEPDVDAVVRLTGVPGSRARECARYAAALSPAAAARHAGSPPVDLDRVLASVTALAEVYDLVVVEGAGGLLVQYDAAGRTVADLARALAAPVLVVVASGLGTLNVTALTLEALAARQLACAGIVVGSWSVEPGLADISNLADLEDLAAAPLAGAFPAGAGRAGAAAFGEVAARSLAPAYGGSFDPTRFRERIGEPL